MTSKLNSKCYIPHILMTKSLSLLIYYSLEYEPKYRYTYLHHIKHEQGTIGGKTKSYCGKIHEISGK